MHDLLMYSTVVQEYFWLPGATGCFSPLMYFWVSNRFVPPLDMGAEWARGGHNVLFSKYEYVPGWMPLYKQFQALFTKKIKF